MRAYQNWPGFPNRHAPWLTAYCLFGNTLLISKPAAEPIIHPSILGGVE
jgi:hypothetical protein